jgi:hypothetical protein
MGGSSGLGTGQTHPARRGSDYEGHLMGECWSFRLIISSRSFSARSRIVGLAVK